MRFADDKQEIHASVDLDVMTMLWNAQRGDIRSISVSGLPFTDYTSRIGEGDVIIVQSNAEGDQRAVRAEIMSVGSVAQHPEVPRFGESREILLKLRNIRRLK